MTYESLLIVAGFKGIIRIIGTSTVNCRAVSLNCADSAVGLFWTGIDVCAVIFRSR